MAAFDFVYWWNVSCDSRVCNLWKFPTQARNPNKGILFTQKKTYSNPGSQYCFYVGLVLMSTVLRPFRFSVHHTAIFEFSLLTAFHTSWLPHFQRPHTSPFPPLSPHTSWCLAEGYRNGDQHLPMGPWGSGRTLVFFRPSAPLVCVQFPDAMENRSIWWDGINDFLLGYIVHTDGQRRRRTLLVEKYKRDPEFGEFMLARVFAYVIDTADKMQLITS